MLLGKKGYSDISLSDFKFNFKDRHYLSFKCRECDNCLSTPPKKCLKHENIRTDIYWRDHEYYKLSVFCVKRGLARGKFIKEAVEYKMKEMISSEKLIKRMKRTGRLF